MNKQTPSNNIIMKKLIYFAVLSALVLNSCAKKEAESPVFDDNNAVSFGLYSQRPQTKAATDMTLDNLKTSGFGVFAFYTAQTAWASYSASTPNFMNNQKVIYDATGSKWKYDPVKYWSNNSGDKFSFFAYAPYASGKTWSSTDKSIAFTVNADVTLQEDLLFAPGLVDKTRTKDALTFAFQHALARIGFNVSYSLPSGDTDQIDGESAKTTIAVSQVVLQKSGSTDGIFYTGGNLLVTAAAASSAWGSQTGTQTFTLTSTNFEDVYSKVTKTATKLNKDNSYIMIIPQKTTFDVCITYTVTTTDTAIGGSVITNTITTNVPEIDFEANKAYTLNLIIGMNEVKVAATVADWTSVDATNVPVPASAS